MKKLKIFLAIAAVAMAFCACKEESTSSSIAGTYTCSAMAYTQMGGRDTVFAARGETVEIASVNDNTVSITVRSHKWVTSHFASVQTHDMGYTVSLQGEGTTEIDGGTYQSQVSGSVSFGGSSLALSVKLLNYSAPLNITFSNQ